MSESDKFLTIAVNPSLVNSYWVVYTLKRFSNYELYHIGLCRFGELLNVPDARREPNFDPNETYILTGEGTYATRADAVKYLSVVRARFKGVMPTLMKARLTSPRKIIKCDQTGEYFITIDELSKARGIYPSTISNHLNGKPGHKTVKGRTYSRVDCPDVKMLVRR